MSANTDTIKIQNDNNIKISQNNEKAQEVERICGNCAYYEVMAGGFGKCKSTAAHGYDLIVEQNSSCETFKNKN